MTQNRPFLFSTWAIAETFTDKLGNNDAPWRSYATLYLFTALRLGVV